MEQWRQILGTRISALFVGSAAALALAGCSAETPNTGIGAPVAPIGQAGAPGAGAGGSTTPIVRQPTAGSGMVIPGPDTNPPVTTGSAVPCEVDKVVKSGCQSCHGASPIGGAPMPLVTLADFQRDYTAVSTVQMAGRSMKMYELARIRINREMGTSPMPQNNPLAPAAHTMLDTWLRGGAQAGTACATTLPVGGAGGTTGGTAGTGIVDPNGRGSECENESTFDPLVAMDGETCYEFLTHGRTGATDTTKFDIPLNETYSQFYFDVPWPAGTVATRFGSRFDNLKVLHHWLAFSSTSGNAHGTVSKGVTGTTLGENTELIAGWAVGGCTTTYPPDVGVKLPTSGKIMVQWHHYNHTGMIQQDGSAVQICTVPQAMRQNIAGLTFLGTEDFNGLFGMGPGKQDFTTSCRNDSGAPITILGFTPHMHTIGSNMKSVINGKTVFDKPFVFDQQVNYMMKPPITLMPNEDIVTTCTFQNDTGANVAFGQSTDQEMCYQFALAYPYGALNNGVISLIGSTNTCW